MTTATATPPAGTLRDVSVEERYLFDLQGYLVVPDALDPARLAGLNRELDARMAAAGEAASHRFMVPESLLSWSPDYAALIDNERILPYLHAFVGPEARLDHDYCDVIRAGLGPIGSHLHGGNTPFEEIYGYHVRDGRIRSALTVIAYNLRDVGPQDGGFGCIPGSHKANFPLPEAWKDLSRPAPPVRAVSAPAGSAIIFTEALTHGTLPWRGRHDRRTLFYKYSPPTMAWGARFYDAGALPGLTERQRAMLEAPNARYGHR